MSQLSLDFDTISLWKELTADEFDESAVKEFVPAPQASTLCKAGSNIWMRHNLGVAGRCRRCGYELDKRSSAR